MELKAVHTVYFKGIYDNHSLPTVDQIILKNRFSCPLEGVYCGQGVRGFFSLEKHSTGGPSTQYFTVTQFIENQKSGKHSENEYFLRLTCKITHK